MIPQERRNVRRSPRPRRNRPQPSTGASQAEALDLPFEGVADPWEVGAEETAEEVFPTEDHRKTQTRQEEYQGKHRPYPTPPTSLSEYHLRYLRATGQRQKTSSYNGAHIAERTEITPHSLYPSPKR